MVEWIINLSSRDKILGYYSSSSFSFVFFTSRIRHVRLLGGWRKKEKNVRTETKVSVMFRTWDRMYYIRTIVPATSCGRSDRRMYLYISPWMLLLAATGKSCDTREQGKLHPNYITVLWKSRRENRCSEISIRVYSRMNSRFGAIRVVSDENCIPRVLIAIKISRKMAMIIL